MSLTLQASAPTGDRRALLAERLRRAAGKAPARQLSFSQQRLWFLEQLEPNSPLYNVPVLVRLTGALDIVALDKCLNTIVARHESLRTRFTWIADAPVQVIDAHARIELKMIDLTSFEGERDTAAQHIVREEARRPFDLAMDRLLRATLIRLEPEHHQLLVVMHHIVSDEWSLKIFFRELSALYSGMVSGEPVALPELPIQYEDYALWQRDRVQGSMLDQQLRYWKEQLCDHPTSLELLPDHPRKAAPGFRGASMSRALSRQLCDRLKQWANQEDATLFMVLLAGLNALLNRYTHQEDIVVATPIAGRNRAETEGLIGFFVNTLLLRTRLAENPTARQIVARVREAALGAYAHQDLPFEKLIEELHPERSLRHLPLTSLMFAVQNGVLEELKWPGVELEFLDLESSTSKFDTTLVVQETSRGLVARMEYNADLFEAATIARLLNHFEVLLEGMVNDPKRRLSELPLLTEAERNQLLVEWNQTATDYPRQKTIHELFEAQVQCNPQATAVVFGRQTLTYGELNARANQLAHHLKHSGVGPDVPVAICVQRSVDMVVGVVAILKAGGAYVPMDPEYPQERLKFMLKDTKSPVVLTQQCLLSRLPKDLPAVICLDADWELIGRESRQDPPAAASAENLAYIIYTSGSSGEPKGVAVAHRAVNRLVLNTNYVEFSSNDRVAQVSSFSFDAATFEIWGALLNGGQLVGITQDVALSPNEFALELKEKGISAIFLTSALFNHLASEVPGAFETVRTVIAGGEALDPKWVRAVLECRPPERLLNGYGPTENTTFTCCGLIRDLPGDATNVPIGRPISNTQVYILDKHLNPVPVGVAGELFSGGDGVARGYWNRPELNEEKFLPNPFILIGPRQPLYRTGDLARYLPDGQIEFLGRIDTQIKIRGFRIELGEIEAVMGRHPAVRECIVTATSDKRLVGYYVLNGAPKPTAGEMKAFLREQLPEYMVPMAFVQLPALPLTANGKIDRKLLPAPDQERPALEGQYASPRDSIETELARIWENVLGIQPIGIHDKFFDLGGHSLLAVRLVARIETAFGRKLRVASIFEGPTIAQVATLLREEPARATAPACTSLVQIQSKGSRPPLFLVHGAGGGMFWGYVNLARHLGADQPIYGFKSRGLDGKEEFDNIEEMAAQYIADLRTVQATGPYFLGGYCFGGNVAYEMARQLRNQGEEIALLALLNCAPPNSRYTRIRCTPHWMFGFIRNLFYWANYFGHWTATQRREFFRWKWARFKKKLASTPIRPPAGDLSHLDARDLVDLSAFSAEEQKVWEAHIRALINYHPKPYSGQAHLFRSPGHPLWCSFDPDYGWGDLAKGGLSITIVPGAHEKILAEPCVRTVAAELERCLRESELKGNSNSEKPESGKPSASQASQVVSNNGDASFRLGPARQESRFSASNEEVVATAKARNSGPQPLSFAQQRVWFLDQLESAHPVYNLLSAVRLQGSLNFKALEQSLNEIVRRHEVLRTVFPAAKGTPTHEARPAVPCELRSLDLSAMPESERKARIGGVLREEKGRPFDLSRETAIRSLLLRVTPQEHLLVLVIHEIAADASSFEVLFRELARIYASTSRGRVADLPQLPIQYTDFAAWQLQQFKDRAWSEHLEFWKRQLSGAPALLELPTDFPRPASQTYRADTETRALSPALIKDLRAFSERHGTSDFTVFLAALAVLLHRYSRQDDILIGTPVTSRDHPEFEGLMGNFANLLLLRTDTSGDPTASELLERTREVSSTAWRRQKLPFETLLDELRPARDQSYHPLCQVLFSRTTHGDTRGSIPAKEKEQQANAGFRAVSAATEVCGLSMSLLKMEQGTTKYDLNFEVSESAGGLAIRIEYATDLFQGESMRRMLGHWEMLVKAMIAEPSRRLSTLPMLTREEERLLLEDWTRTERPYPKEKTLSNMFEEQVARTPEAVALVSGNTRLTYQELQARATAVADRLRSMGIGHESLVGICLERSWELIAGILGVLQTGAAYVPLDPAYPKDRLAFILQDAKLQALITEDKLLHVLPAGGAPVLCIKDINWEHSQNVTRPPKPHVSRPTPSTSLAYVIYTSGSTGQPKGVALEHRNAVAMVSWAREVFSQEELSGVLASTSVCFDLSIFEMFVPLSWGGKVILAENALALATLPAAKEVRLINTVPSAIRELLRIKAVPDSVRVVNLAGEPLATSLVNEIYEKTATQKVYDLYGPTETTTYSTYTLRKPNERASIGRPLANEQVYLLDGSMHPVPIGVPGDLYIGGAGVTRGYLNRPQMTAERFVAHPFKMGARIYKTGDLARWRPDGNLEFLGRSDHQVKIRGFRIELGEIEVVLKKYPAVQEVVVVAREDKPGDKRLVAYVVVHKGQTATSDDLRNAVRQSLPEYMTPSAFVLLDALPLTPNGKVDRKALPAPDQERSGSGAEFVAPRTPVEEQLAGIWREVLGVPQVGIHDSFFDLGGHSLLAVQAISRIREIFAIELPLLSLFDASTIASLAEGLSSNRWARAEHPVSPLQRVARDSFLPVSFVQERLWFLDQLEPGSHAYNVPTALRLIGPLDLAAFVRALDEVVSRHEALRTSFKYQDGHLTQVIAPPVPLELRLTDLRSATIEDREEQARRWVATQAQEPFDLARGPLFRASLAQLSETEHILTVVTHHSVSDGWSMALFFKELGIAYQSFSTGQPAQNLPELPVQYADFAHWQRNWMTGEVLEKELVFWKERLMGAPAALELPTDHLEPEQPTRKAGRFTLQFPEGFAASVLELSQREGSTPFMVLMSALTITLHQWTTQQDMVIGTVVAGRNRRELENVIGCFMNFLPIRARISEAENGQQILAQLRESILQAQSHQDCPFEKLVEAINPERRLNQNPLYNVALLLQNFPTEPFQGPSLRASPFPVAMEAALLDLRFEAEITEQNLSLLCEYKTELFELSTIDQLLAAYQQVLQVLITKPETSIEDFPTPSGLKSQAVSVRGRQAKHTLAISATFTAEPVADSLRYWMAKLEVPARIEFAPYHQVFQQLLDPSSLQATNSRGLNVVLLRLEDWQSADAAPGSVSTGNGENPIEHNAREFVMALKSATERSITPFLICFCPASRAALANPRQADLFVRVEQALVAELEKLTGVYTLQSRELSDWYPVADYDDPSATALGHVPYTPIAYTALGTAVARKFQALNRVAYKVVVLDCDQTLWSGVCGEDGPTGIRLDPPRQALQNFMRARHESGMLLCLCSKNSEQDVEAVFKQRLDMALRREHFVAVKLNWNAKSENIKALAEELNLGLNSFIFVDDNPLECAEVEANCPEVLTLLLPEDTAQISQFLQHCWAFDHLKLTTEDRRRAEMYRQNHQREQLRAQTMSLSDFLAGLELKVSIEPMSPPQLPRIAQLTQRTNQFNFTTRRHTENSLQKVPAGCEVLSVQVRDRFGDYGLAGAMIYSPKGEVLEVDSFLLSCRVLGRGVEHGMLARLGAIARERQLKSVELPFFPTERNKPALDFLENIARSCPECRQASNGSVVYRVPVEFAAQIHFDPQNDPADKSTLSVAPRDAISTPAASPLIRLSRFREIALSANDAAKIHEEMEAKSVSRATSHTGYAPPNTDLEHKLCQLWQGLLHLERVGIHDNFFELGGHSLLAVRLFVEVEKITGQKFPLVTLFQAPTIERLAGVLSQSQSASPHPLLVPVQPNGSKPPLILVHGAGGDVLWGYANLAAHLPADQPVYGIKSRGQTGVEDFRKIEDMANWYVQQLRAFQPHGPYYLGGYCFGGNVAYEMARMLSKDGEEVALLALLDTAPANAGYERIPWWRPSYVYRFARNVSRWIEDFNRLQPEVRRSFARRKARVWGRKLRRKFSLQRGRSEVDLEDVIEFSHFPEHELKLWHIHLQALADHQQQPYEGEVTLLRTQGQPLFCSLSEDFCWSKLAKGVRIKVIPGSHEDIFVEPNVSALAKELEVCLEQAQARFLCETPETQLALCQNTL